MTNPLPAFPAPSPAYLLELVASWHGFTGKQLIAGRTSRRHSLAKFDAASLMRRHHYSWPVIAKALGYAGHCSAIHAARRWERMRRAGR